MIESTPASRAGAKFIVGDGVTIPNQGQKQVNMVGLEEKEGTMCEGELFSSVFQVTRVTRPLMSVSQICDNGHTVEFDNSRGVVRDSNKRIVCVFKRVGGFYLGRFKLKSPFARRA